MKKRWILTVLAGLICFSGAVSRLEAGRQAQGKLRLERALRRSAAACYASEGFYPPDAAYLQEHYGLVYEEERYVVRYEYVAANLMPEITVLEK